MRWRWLRRPESRFDKRAVGARADPPERRAGRCLLHLTSISFSGPEDARFSDWWRFLPTCRNAPRIKSGGRLCARCSCSWCVQGQKWSIARGDRVTFLLRGQEKDDHCTAGAARTAKPAGRAGAGCPGVKEKGYPAWRLPGLDQPLLHCLNPGIPADARCEACRPPGSPPHNARVGQRAMLPRTFQKSWSNAPAATLPI